MEPENSRVLEKLEEAELQVCRLLEIAQSTCSELSTMPASNQDKLKSLSDEYFTVVTSVRETLVQHASLLKKSNTKGSLSDDKGNSAEATDNLQNLERYKTEIEKSLAKVKPTAADAPMNIDNH